MQSTQSFYQSKSVISKIRISPRINYEVVYSTDLGPDILGECRFDKKQIVIKIEQSDEELKKTLIHEIMHAICDTYKIDISHSAIYKLEKAVLNLIKLNKWLK